MLFREPLLELNARLIRVWRLHKLQTIADTMYVGVYTDAFHLAEPGLEEKVRHLVAHPG